MYNPKGFIKLEEDTHTYTDIANVEYASMSRVLKSVKIPFDTHGVSARMTSNKEDQQKLIKQWEHKGKFASDYGTRIHNALEDFMNAKKVSDAELESLGKRISVEFKEYAMIYPEAILHLFDKKIAGTTDVLAQRQKRGNVYDFYDYKTNIDKGIYFDSVLRKNGELRHINKYFLDPLSHLEDCNYNEYALQLSGYAYMAEMTYGIKPGKLFIIFIFKKIGYGYDYRLIPVPYLKFEVARLFQHFSELKPLI